MNINEVFKLASDKRLNESPGTIANRAMAYKEYANEDIVA